MYLNNVQSSFNNEFFSKGKILQELLYKVTAAEKHSIVVVMALGKGKNINDDDVAALAVGKGKVV